MKRDRLMESIEKEFYEAPTMLIVEVQTEGVLTGSDGTGTGEDFGWD